MELIVILLAFLVGAFANGRNRSGFFWFLISLIISPLFAFIVLLILPTIPKIDRRY